MNVSEARVAANRSNGLKSKGPSSPEGRRISSRNSLKHGMTGAGVVLPEGDAEEILRRVDDLDAELKPKTAIGRSLLNRIATFDVRIDRSFKNELAEIGRNVRHAVEDHEQEQIDKARDLFAKLAEDPRYYLRKLLRFPEGIELLFDTWDDLKVDLNRRTGPNWGDDQLRQATILLGMLERHAEDSRFGILTMALNGDFSGLEPDEGGELDLEGRKLWAKSALLEQIDAEMAALEGYYQDLDHEALERDRLEAPDRALFDSSKRAILARRYERESDRSYHKALKEFRQVEAEAAALAALKQPPPPAATMGSFRENAEPAVREPSPPDLDDLMEPAPERFRADRTNAELIADFKRRL